MLNTGYNTIAINTINSILGSVGFSKVKPALQVFPGTSIFIFDDAINMTAWFTTTAWSTPAEKQAAWNTYNVVSTLAEIHPKIVFLPVANYAM